MKVLRPRRFARWRANSRGFWPQGRPGGGDLILDRQPGAGSHPPAVLLVALLLFCFAVFSAVLICRFIAGQGPTMLGVLGFTGIGLFLAYGVVRVLINREQLLINSRCIDYLRIDGMSQERRRIPLRAIRRLSPFRVMVDRRDCLDWQRFHPEYGLLIETLGRPLWVGLCRDPDEAYRLVEVVDGILRERFPGWADVAECPDRQVLDASAMLPRPPSDSTLSCRREWDRTEFIRHNPVDVYGSRRYVLISLISTAIVGIMLALARPGLGWTFAFILAGLVGLLELIGWWGWASQRRRWVLRPGEIRTSIPGLGPLGSRTTEIEWLDRIELRRLPVDACRFARRSPGFQLVLVDPDGVDTANFGPLTEGEARWMAGVVADVLRDALPRGDQEVYRWSVTVDEPTGGSRAMADAWLDEVLPQQATGAIIPGKPVGGPTADGRWPTNSSESSTRRR